ncbi:hypothetical protein E4T38_09578 [Aureobasidium subglaciale]|nr:hypothetical protein E4T38_09578 [Aureobasidium subglaciale]KAI5213700.1 hypothetical protein E4T40_09534 [Aureobasidium subglaciale]KAI5215536.1 hypothetical protein E4T41_09572 [Aureobasidium subglaciale]KAI5253363.1 hypothetical protein E4T46_09512 [Aureobasidium subglaciale]
MNQPGIHTESDDVTPVPSLVEDSESSSIQHVKVKRVSSKPDGSDDNANQPIGEDCYGGPSPLDGGSRALRQSNNRSSSINEDRGTVDTYEILKNEEMPVEHFMATADKIRDCPRPSSSRRKSPFRFPAWLVHQTGKDEREEMIQEPTARDSGKHPPSSRVTAHETIEDEHPRPIEPVATGSDMRFNAVERLDHWAILHGTVGKFATQGASRSLRDRKVWDPQRRINVPETLSERAEHVSKEGLGGRRAKLDWTPPTPAW